MAQLASRGRTLLLRPVAALTAALFAVSTALPVGASLVRSPDPPAWIAYFDVTVAAALFALVLFLNRATRGARPPTVILASYRGCRLLWTVALVLIVVFFAVGDRIAWDVLLLGLAWRSWLFMYGLPALISALARR